MADQETASQPAEKQATSLGKWKQIEKNVFEVRAMSRGRALEVGARLMNVPPDEVQARPIRDRPPTTTGSQRSERARVHRYRVTLKPVDGRFNLTVDGRAVFVAVEPARNDGRPVAAEHVQQELDRWPVSALDLAALSRAVYQCTGQPVLVAHLALPPDLPKHGVAVLVSEDKMRAHAVAQGRFAKGQLERAVVEEALARAGVVAGIRSDEVRAYLPARDRSRPVLIARGQEPVKGDDAVAEWLVPLAVGEPVPAVSPGQPLARLRDAGPGLPGTTVTGETLPGPDGEVHELGEFASEGVALSADGTLLVADRAGRPTIRDGKIAVLAMEEVEVVHGTRQAVGHLMVRGNVGVAASLRAAGDVEVGQGIDGGARVHAGGSILVKGGVGANTFLTTGQNLVARFLHGGVARAAHVVRISHEILNGTVWAGDQVVVVGRGRIAGGLVRAGKEVVAETIGDEQGRRTRIVVGEGSGGKEADDARVVATRSVLPGTLIRIGDAELEVEESLGPTVFGKEGGKVVAKPLSEAREGPHA